MASHKLIKLSFAVAAVVIASAVLAYDNKKTHPDLASAAIDLYQKSTGKPITDEQKAMIVKGSIDEDVDPRYLNHFYNPSTGKGLNGNSSAKEWSQAQGGAAGVTGDFSEAAILKNYKQGNTALAYQGIGHMLHLVQDMAVPAHVRDDSHGWGDYYEEWAMQYGKTNIQKTFIIEVTSLPEAFDHLSNFTNANFYSSDSVDVKELKGLPIEKETVNGEDVGYVMAEFNGIKYRLVYVKNPDSPRPLYRVTNDFKLNLDYWNMLSPGAIGYSAGVIDYFVRKFEEIDKNRDEIKISFWNKIGNFFNAVADGFEYQSGENVKSGGDTARGIVSVMAGAVANIWQAVGFFGAAVEETVVKVADTTVESGKKAADVTEKAAKKVAVTTVDLGKKAVGQGKVLGQKIVKAAVKPVRASVKAPSPKLPLVPSAPIVTIAPVKPAPNMLPPVFHLPPSTSTPTVMDTSKPLHDFSLVYPVPDSPLPALVTETATVTISIIEPPATTTSTSTDWGTAASSTSATSSESVASSTDSLPEVNASSTASTTNPVPHVVISEIYVNERHDGSEWVELYNPSSEAVDLSGWKLDTKADKDGDATLLPGATMEPYGYYLIGDLAADKWRPDSRRWVRPDHLNDTIALANQNGWVRLRDATGTTIDQVGWGEAQVFETATTSMAGYDKGRSFKRRGLMDEAFVLDSDNNRDDFMVNDIPDPERYAPTCAEIPNEDGVITEGQLTIDHSPYCVRSWLTVASGDSLSIEPGVIIKFQPNVGLHVEGELSAIGTSDEVVYFTSFYDDIGGKIEGWSKRPLVAGDWAGLEFTPGSQGRFDWSTIRYGGTYKVNLASAKPKSLQKWPQPRLAMMLIPDLGEYPVINIIGGNVIIENSVINNNSRGVKVSAGGTLAISGSQFVYNGTGLINETDQEVIAIGNFWGDSLGPFHQTLNPEGMGDGITGLVVIDPWLTDNPWIFN